MPHCRSTCSTISPARHPLGAQDAHEVGVTDVRIGGGLMRGSARSYRMDAATERTVQTCRDTLCGRRYEPL